MLFIDRMFLCKEGKELLEMVKKGKIEGTRTVHTQFFFLLRVRSTVDQTAGVRVVNRGAPPRVRTRNKM